MPTKKSKAISVQSMADFELSYQYAMSNSELHATIAFPAAF